MWLGARTLHPQEPTFDAEGQKAKAAVAKAEADLRYAKEGVEVFRAEPHEFGRHLEKSEP